MLQPDQNNLLKIKLYITQHLKKTIFRQYRKEIITEIIEFIPTFHYLEKQENKQENNLEKNENKQGNQLRKFLSLQIYQKARNSVLQNQNKLIALSLFNMSISIYPFDYYDYCERGSIYLNLKEFQLSQADYEHCYNTTDQFKQFDYILQHQVNKFIQNNLFQEAIQTLEKIKENPKYQSPKHQGQIILWLGTIYIDIKAFLQSIPYLTQAIQNDDNSDAYNNRAFAYINIGEYQLAEKDLQKAISQEKHGAFPYKNLALLNYYQNKLELATSYIEKALAISPNNERILEVQQLIKDKFINQKEIETQTEIETQK